MISRVLSGPGPAPDVSWHGLPPGTPDSSPLQIVVVDGDNVGVALTTPIITTDGAPVYSTGAGSWGQLHAAGRA